MAVTAGAPPGVRLGRCTCYANRMAKPKKFDLQNPAPVVDDEDAETLAAIDEGLQDAEAGRTVPTEEVRRLVPNRYLGG